MNLIVESVSLQLVSVIPGHETHARSGHSLRMTVYPAGKEYIELKRGELFQNPSLETKNNISAELVIYPAFDDTFYESNEMCYLSEKGSDSGESFSPEISFRCFLPQNDFCELLNNIRSRIMPSSLYIKFDFRTFEGKGAALSLLPGGDGSGLKWNNDTEVRILEIIFFYELQ